MKLLGIMFSFCMMFNSIAQELQYPELNVTPRASDRIKLELKDEKQNLDSSFLPIQLSAVATLVAGGMSSSEIKEDKEDEGGEKAPLLAMGVGLGWLGATVWASMKYRPYKTAYNKLKGFKGTSLRDRLTLERLAEEEINNLRSIGKKMRYLSVASNLIASGVLLENVEPKTDANMMAATSALVSLAPLFFKTHWEKVGNEQAKYKKKIFSPVAIIPVTHEPFQMKKAVGLNLMYQF